MLAALAAAAALVLAGCGGDEDGDEGPTRLEQALEGLGSGVSPTGVGFGWADLGALRGYPIDTAFAADALGPGADDLIDDEGPILDATGTSPGFASEALSIQGSYALGVRFDDLDPARLPSVLRRAGATERQEGPWSLFDLGRPAQSEPGGPLRPFGALISRVATGPDGVVFARFEGARASLTGFRGSTDLSGTRIEPATECLGDVAAARMVPGTFTHDVPESPELIAFAVEDPIEGVPPNEIICAVDDTEALAERRADGLESAFAEGATDPVTAQPMEELAEAGEVTTEQSGDYWVTRVVLERPEGSQPSLLFDAFVRGSLVAYLGGDRPIPSTSAPGS
jgi:hypothetical protein